MAQETSSLKNNPAADTGELSFEVRACSFKSENLLSPLALSRLRAHQENFARALAARLSLLLRLEISIKLGGLQTISYKSWMEDWSKPSCLTLFKADPLRGVSVLEIPPRVASAIVDRLMGGPGKSAEREMSEVERALLEQASQIILGEWCRHWAKFKELKPVLLGYETNGEFIQIAPDTNMLALSMEISMGDCAGRIQMGFPYSGVESLVRQLSRDTEMVSAAPAPVSPASPQQWRACFDEIPIPLTAEWDGLELAAGEILNLKAGDVLRIDARSARQVRVRLGDKIKFNARLGTVSDHWAVELTETIRP
ncbi:MAG TPA: FliM/FliN family flagellar motor switch protein [Verrucomicrobiae bacterium]|nr:FliM/FliN family flagellar motor switch protein [Verrucomicrobiae bacterium]